MGVFTCALPCRTRGPEGICQAQCVPQNTTLYLLNYTRVKVVDEHGSYIRSNVPLTSVERGLTEVGQR